jgi:hypothetical protein
MRLRKFEFDCSRQTIATSKQKSLCDFEQILPVLPVLPIPQTILAQWIKQANPFEMDVFTKKDHNPRSAKNGGFSKNTR